MMNRLRLLFITVSLASSLALLGGCAARYSPIDTQIKTIDHDQAHAMFLPALIKHLAEQRGYPFAKGFLRGLYRYVGSQTTEDGSTVVFLFEAVGAPDLKWSYVLLSFGKRPYMFAQKNASPEAAMLGTSDDGDGVFRGLYKLTIMDARYCSGDTKEMPVIEGNAVRLSAIDRVLKKSILTQMRNRYTPTYCQDTSSATGRPEAAGVRFYFDTQEDLEEFASVFMGAFPQVRYEGGGKTR